MALVINPVQKADLCTILRLTPNPRRLKVAAAFLGLTTKAFMRACDDTGTPHGQRFTTTPAFRMRIAAALDVPYSAIWEEDRC